MGELFGTVLLVLALVLVLVLATRLAVGCLPDLCPDVVECLRGGWMDRVLGGLALVAGLGFCLCMLTIAVALPCGWQDADALARGSAGYTLLAAIGLFWGIEQRLRRKRIPAHAPKEADAAAVGGAVPRVARLVAQAGIHPVWRFLSISLCCIGLLLLAAPLWTADLDLPDWFRQLVWRFRTESGRQPGRNPEEPGAGKIALGVLFLIAGLVGCAMAQSDGREKPREVPPR